MTDAPAPQPPPVSARKLAVATAAAAGVAAVILVVAVLPAEYGIDPLHTGAFLRLVREPAAPPAGAAAAPPAGGDTMSYKVDYAELEVAPYDYVEYKYRLAQAATMVYSWEASAAVIQDFHGAPDGGGAEAEVSLEKQSKVRGTGSLTAAFAGMHGWYWENPGGAPITIKVRSAGFYSAAIEYRSNRTQRVHQLGTPESGAAPPAGR